MRKNKTLDGYKTYLTAAAMVTYGVAGFYLGLHDGDMATYMVLTAFSFIGLRNALPPK